MCIRDSFKSFVSAALPAITSSMTMEQQQLVEQLLVTELDESLRKGFSKLRFAYTARNGYLLVLVAAEQVTASYYLIDASELAEPYYDNPEALNERFSTYRFVLRNGVITEA